MDQLFLFDDYLPNNNLKLDDEYYFEKFLKIYVDKKIKKIFISVYPKSRPFWVLYVLLCKNDVLYVGITKNIKKRMFQHFFSKKNSSAVTIKHDPIKVIKLMKTNETLESRAAKFYENRYVLLAEKLVKNKKIYGGLRHIENT